MIIPVCFPQRGSCSRNVFYIVLYCELIIHAKHQKIFWKYFKLSKNLNKTILSLIKSKLHLNSEQKL